MSLPPPLNTRLAQAMMAARVGYLDPPAMGEGPRGHLFSRLIQADIEEKLPPSIHAQYQMLRAEVRTAVEAARMGHEADATAAFDAAERILTESGAGHHGPELSALGRSWIDQGYAYFALRQKDLDEARRRLTSAMDADTALELDHGYDLMHIGRVHTVHLWIKLLAASGDVTSALDEAEAVLSYVSGGGESLAIGHGWTRARTEAIRPELKAAMSARIATECAALLSRLPCDHISSSLARVPSLATSPHVPDEVAAFVNLKSLWADGDSVGFLEAAAPLLQGGRGQTGWWYAALLDLVRLAAQMRPKAGAIFAEDIAQRVTEDPSDGEVFPGALRAALKRAAQPAQSHSAYIHRPRPSRCHLICVGLPRSGTTSLYTLSTGLRTGNEYLESETIRALSAWMVGEMPDQTLDEVLLKRQSEGSLEMDAASFMHLAADRLPTLFPNAKFVHPVRGPAVWFESYLKMLLRWHGAFSAQGKAPPEWMQNYGTSLFGHFDWAEIATPDARRIHLPKVAERFLKHWNQATRRTLSHCPPERTLVFRTEDLGPRRADIAELAGLPVTAFAGPAHSNASPAGNSPLDGLAPGALQTLVDRHCAEAQTAISNRLRASESAA